MAQGHKRKETDGCPDQSVELPGKIISAAKSTFDEKSFEKGYPELRERLKMDNVGGRKK
jgi:hypothetical protein